MSAVLSVNIGKPFQSLAAHYAYLTDNADIGGAAETPLVHAPEISQEVDTRVFLKMEALQPDTYAFKVRGAFNKMAKLTQKARNRGVITASAGNHAQGVAKAAKTLGIAATIVMPETTPQVKVKNVRRLNPDAKIVLHGDSFPEALAYAKELEKKDGLTFVHPYDDELVIAGQGTIACEVFSQYEALFAGNSAPVEAIFVPIGGGGLIAGIAAWVKHYHPDVKIIGVESHDSNCMEQAIKAGRRVKLNHVGLFADGVAVAQAGKKTYDVARQYVDEIICVSDNQISAAAIEILADTRQMVEPAGAMAVAGIKKYKHNGGTLVGIVSGGNVSPERFQDMLERAAIAQHRETLLSIALPERPGSLRDLCEQLGDYNVTKFKYRFVADDQEAHILIGLGTKDARKEAAQIVERLQKAGYQKTKDETNNELVREHISKMVGGKPQQPLDETLYSFEFLERSGELRKFLRAMPGGCNITLFDYQNHGKARGQVLMGFNAPLDKRQELQKFLKNPRWNGKNQTRNPAYADFLQPARNPRKSTKSPRLQELAIAA